MPFLAGIDEAGYGPLLGPLVVSATLWRIERRDVQSDLWAELSECVRRKSGRGDGRIAVDDSKKVFDRKKGIATLERPVLAFASAAGLTCASLRELLSSLGADPTAWPAEAPWYHDLDQPLPLDRSGSAYEGIRRRLDACMKKRGVVCCRVATEVVTAGAYNRRVNATRNKATVLLEQVLRLIDRLARSCGESDLHVVVDRLGGRSNYRGALRDAFPDRHLHIVEQSPAQSRYRLTSQRGELRVDFVVDADQKHLPVALASMFSKYVREALMARFNEYWRRRVPTLRPTAGYYSDARRFLEDIRPSAAEAGIALERFVRAR